MRALTAMYSVDRVVVDEIAEVVQHPPRPLRGTRARNARPPAWHRLQSARWPQTRRAAAAGLLSSGPSAGRRAPHVRGLPRPSIVSPPSAIVIAIRPSCCRRLGGRTAPQTPPRPELQPSQVRAVPEPPLS